MRYKNFGSRNSSTGDETCGWDGKISGQPATPGLYVYAAKVVFADQQTFVYRGEINLFH